jgi:antitoxin (DNA-binding transcriptional repressor) of toxin-antitoxin stability system
VVDRIDAVSPACHVFVATTIQIPICELHARPGHFVRKAEVMRVIITDNGRPIALLQPLGADVSRHFKRPKWKDRILLPGYAAVMNTPVPGDSAAYISEDRDRDATGK